MNQKQFENEIQEKQTLILNQAKESGLYTFVEKTVDENNSLIKNTIKKHGTKKSWVKSFLISKLNVNNDELKKFFPHKKFVIVLPTDTAEFTVTVAEILKVKHGID